MGSLTINLKTPFITPGCSTRILRTIFELLLYNRKQIPFPYSTFRMMVKKLNTADIDVNSVAGLHSNKQREKALGVINNAEQLLETLDKILSNHPTSELMILFGKTIYTAKEAFVIKLPAVDASHYAEHHQRKLENILQQIGLQLNLWDELVTAKSELYDTNIFVLLESSASPDRLGYGMNLLDDYQLPRKCVTYSITLKTSEDSVDAMSYSCCKLLKIYCDDTDQSLTHATQHSPTTTVSASRWFLLDTVVSGYSIKSPKDYKLWQ